MQAKIEPSTQGDLDAALVICLRIAAARGRSIRENGDSPDGKIKRRITANDAAQARNEQRTAAISFGIIAQTKGSSNGARTK